jgi:hypothetical protein
MFSGKAEGAPLEEGYSSHDAEKLANIKRICGLGKLSAQSFVGRSEQEMFDEMRKFDLRRYKLLLGNAIKLTRAIDDQFYRAAAIHQIIDLLLAGGHKELAQTLFDTVDIAIVKESVLAQHPQLRTRLHKGVAAQS